MVHYDPLVSVLMPAYNCEAFVENAIRGILGQEYDHFEFVIINDGSTDNTKEIIRGFGDHRIRYFENEKNQGLVGTLNRGLGICQGKYILRADADDFAYPYMMGNFVKFMEQHPDHVVCGANIRIRYADRCRVFKYPPDDDRLRVYALDGCPFSSHTFIRRSVLVGYGLRYRDSFYPGEDHGLWSEMLRYGKLHNLQEISSIYNKANNLSITAGKDYRHDYPLARRTIFESHAKQYFDLNEEDTRKYIRLHACSDRFLQVIMPKMLVSAEELEDIGRLVVQILKKNNHTGFFKKRWLRNFLALKWIMACYNNRRFHTKTLRISFRWLTLMYNT